MFLGSAKLRAIVAGSVAMTLANTASLVTARAQTATGPLSTAPGANLTAGHDIVMRAHVAPSCRVTNAVRQIRLNGKADDGQTIDTTVSGAGGFIVDCNTPYAIQLARSSVYAPAAARKTLASREPTAADETAVADAAETSAVLAQARDLNVVMRVAGRDGPIESNCVMGDGESSPFVCHAVSGPEDARLPMPRAAASMIITGALADPTGPQNGSEASLPAAGTVSPVVAVPKAPRIAATKDSAKRVYLGDRLTVSLTARF